MAALPMPDLLMLKWLLASASCAGAGLLVWLVLEGAARLWPALRTRRAVWLAAQGVVAAAALLPFLPRVQIGITPAIMLAPAAASPQPAPDWMSRPATRSEAASRPPAEVTATDDAPGSDHPAAGRIDSFERTPAEQPASASRVMPALAALWLCIYTAGLTWAVTRLARARRVWRDLLATAQGLSPAELLAHGGFTASQLHEIAEHRLTVLRIDAAISPMLIGVRHPRLLLPAQLQTLGREQQHMIIAHELHHWRARDPLCLAIAALLQTIFWFNPALRWMARQMTWALELSCDQHVLAGRPQQQRKQYAAALLQQWITPAGAAAFGGATISARIRHMQQDGLPALNAATAWLIGAALTAILALGALLQPALAYSVPAAPPAAVPAEPWRAPLDKVRVTSFFGVASSVLPTPHKGIDFTAAKGTPVHATASGIVVAAGRIAENHGRYGNTVIIDHGAEQSLYAHLDSVSVQPGQHVQAGQLIGASGQTGFATGPHLHLEVRQNGHHIDPAIKLTNLDAYATPRALKVRRQQKG